MGRRYHVLLVSSSGGVFLDLLALEPWWSRHQPRWAAVRAPDTASVLAGSSVYWLKERSASRPLGVLADVLRAWRILGRERPDLLVSAGTGCAVGFFVAARARRVPTIWLTTFNLVATPGLAERICSSLASTVLLQRASMVSAHPEGVVVGELY